MQTAIHPHVQRAAYEDATGKINAEDNTVKKNSNNIQTAQEAQLNKREDHMTYDSPEAVVVCRRKTVMEKEMDRASARRSSTMDLSSAAFPRASFSSSADHALGVGLLISTLCTQNLPLAPCAALDRTRIQFDLQVW